MPVQNQQADLKVILDVIDELVISRDATISLSRTHDGWAIYVPKTFERIASGRTIEDLTDQLTELALNDKLNSTPN